MIKQCAVCNKDFDVDITKRNWQCKKFCSPECQRVHTNLQSKIRYAPIEWPQKKVCVRCAVDFLIYEGGNMAQKYCGQVCQLSAKEEKRLAGVEARKQTKKCERCDAIFIANKYAAHKQRFCSDECKVIARNIWRYSNGSDGSKIRNAYKYDFKCIKPKILERDGNKCVICGSAENVHIHHMDNSGGSAYVNNSHENLVVLCGVCHYAIHGITLAKIGGKWILDSKIFKLLGLIGDIPIKQ